VCFFIVASLWYTLNKLYFKPPENAALRTVVDLGIFPILVKDGQKNGLSAADIAVCTGADKGLIGMPLINPEEESFLT
jgi:hypothetical protein